jgi:hypothetical protein
MVSYPSVKNTFFGTALVCLVVTTSIQARDDIRTYTVPKEKAPVAQPAPAQTAHASQSEILVASVPREGHTWFFKIKGDRDTIESAKPAFLEFLKSIQFTDAAETPVKWNAPSGWEERPAGNMVIARLSVPGPDGKNADVSITSFPGDVGGELKNVNRWRQQLGLPEVAEVPKSEPITVGGVQGKFYDIGGEAASSAQPETAAASTPPAAAPSATESDNAGPKLDVPSNWKEKQPGPMVLKSYTITGPKGDATVSISSFPGDVGGKLLNVNRWRRQLGQPEIDESQLNTAAQNFETPTGTGYMVDVDGTDAKTGKPARLIAVAVPNAGNTWFYKLLGDKAAVEESKDGFLKFVKNVRY